MDVSETMNITALVERSSRETSAAFEAGLEQIGAIRSDAALLTAAVNAILSLVDDSSQNDGSSLDDFLSSAESTAGSAEDLAVSLTDSANTAVLAGIASSLRELHRRATELSATSMLANITSAGLMNCRDVEIFVRALNERSHELKEAVGLSRSSLQSARDETQAAQLKLVEMASEFRVLLRDFESDRSRLSELRAAHEAHISATHAANAALAKDVGIAVGRLIACLQFPDAFAQRADHVATILRSLEHDRPADERAAIIRIAGAQLTSMSDDLAAICIDAISALEMIRTAVADASGGTWKASPSSGWISALKRGSDTISAAAAAARVRLGEATATLESTSRHVNEAAEALQASQSLNAELTCAARNASIVASRAGSSNNALSVLAGCAKDVVGEVAKLTAGQKSGLDTLCELSSSLERSDLTESIASLDRVRLRSERDAREAATAGEELDRLQTQVLEHSERIVAASEIAAKAFADAGDQEKVLRVAAERLAVSVADTTDPHANVDTKWIFDLYTMDEERVVHCAIFPIEEAESEETDEEEDPDELDGFLM